MLVLARAAAQAATTPAARRQVHARIGRLLDDLLARIDASPDAMSYARAFEALDLGLPVPACDGVGAQLLAALVELSDVLLDCCEPCRAEARPRRRHRIVRRGDGYPVRRPSVPTGTRLYRLVDEREYLVLPCTRYTIHDWTGLPHGVIAPAGDRGDGLISRDVLRAFLAESLSSIYKKCERLTPRARRGRYSVWPYATRMPGLVSVGTKEDIVVRIGELLRVQLFGLPPAGCDDDDDPCPPSVPAPPPLPPRIVVRANRETHRDDLAAEEPLEITELILPSGNTVPAEVEP
ncbi:MAG TPA: hypothetical protein VJZ76_03425 [Thermoanaerobaculia bacterium]|nr:hypothetical protein [Thermoanaerobaculia bacterium]